MRARSSWFVSATVLVALVAFGLLCWGCGGLTLAKLLPPGTIPEPATNPLLNTFTSVNISSGSASANCPGSITVNNTTISCVAEVRTFKSDGTWTSTNPSGATSGTWQEDSGQTTLSITNNGTQTVGTITFGTGNNFFDYTVNGVTTQWQKN